MVLVKDFTHAQSLFEAFILPAKPAPRYTLKRMRLLMAYLGNPQNTLKIIHVAGTSGKTSTAYYAAALLKSSGFTVGLSTSPHIDSIAERAQINLQIIPETLYCQELGIFLDLLEKSNITPSYFEALVAFSFWLFERQGVDYTVIEVGLGGLLDSTNVISRDDKIGIITDIGYDHTEILGSTLPEIAAQKAGIIHKANRVFMHAQDSEIMNVIRSKVETEGASLNIIESDQVLQTTADFQLLPAFQQRNFSLAYGAVKTLISQPENIKGALATYVPARMEAVQWASKTVILDGSHNEQKMAALVEAMESKYPAKSVVLLVSFGKNKSLSIKANLTLLRTISSHIIITNFDLGKNNMRTPIDAQNISLAARELGFTAELKDNPVEAFEYALKQSEAIVLVTGSFYLLNHIRPVVAHELHHQ